MQIAVNEPRLERFVQDQLSTGRFRSAEDVVSTALALLEHFGPGDPDDDSGLRTLVAAGIDEADRGRTVPWIAGEVRREVEARFEEKRPERPELAPRLRRFPVRKYRNYLVLYRIIDGGVEIIRA